MQYIQKGLLSKLTSLFIYIICFPDEFIIFHNHNIYILKCKKVLFSPSSNVHSSFSSQLSSSQLVLSLSEWPPSKKINFSKLWEPPLLAHFSSMLLSYTYYPNLLMLLSSTSKTNTKLMRSSLQRICWLCQDFSPRSFLQEFYRPIHTIKSMMTSTNMTISMKKYIRSHSTAIIDHADITINTKMIKIKPKTSSSRIQCQPTPLF